MKYGYARVSTLQQDLEAQIQALKNSDVKEENIFTDKLTGTKMDRPNFNKLLNRIKKGDTLVVTKIDRIARSMTEGSNLVKELIDKGIQVHILNIGIMDNQPSSKLIRNIFFAFAEFERDMIVERTQEGKAIARQNPDYREGRPKKYSKKQIEHALQLKQTYSYKQVEEMTGISKSTLIRAKRERGLISSY